MHTLKQTHTPLVSILFSLDNSLMYHSTMSYRKGPYSSLMSLAFILTTDIDVVCVAV